MIQKLFALMTVLACTAIVCSPIHAQTPGPFEACNSVVGVRSGGFIYKNSAPIRSGGVGTPLIGYREEPTLIMLRRNVGQTRTTTIYSATGSVLGRCPWATAHDAPGGRYRCTMKTSALRRKAVKLTDSATIYMRLKAGSCVEVPDAGKCYGSVKGLCTKTIK